jgi:hypothetical protein
MKLQCSWVVQENEIILGLTAGKYDARQAEGVIDPGQQLSARWRPAALSAPEPAGGTTATPASFRVRLICTGGSSAPPVFAVLDLGTKNCCLLVGRPTRDQRR